MTPGNRGVIEGEITVGITAHDQFAAVGDVLTPSLGVLYSQGKGHRSTVVMDLDTLIPVGQGASGKVYRTTDANSGRTVAVKVIEQSGVEAHARVRREVAAQKSLNHPSICELYELIEDEGDLLLVMEYVDGVPLGEAIADLDLDSRVQLLIDIAEGVAHAHERGVIHRDIKPGNILVREDDGGWQPKIVDFGIAQLAGAPTLTAAGQVMGTPAYMAPEQAMGSELVDRRVDVYALGAILYLMLTDRPAFQGSSAEVISQLRAGKSVRPGNARPDVPASLERICLKAMALSPRRRYPHVRQLIADLRAYQQGETIGAGALWQWRMERLWRRHRLPIVAGGISLLAVVVLTISLWLGEARAREQARIAAEFARTAEQTANRFRLVQMVPGQDLARARAQVDATITGIQKQAGEIGAVASAPAGFVIGRLHSQLGRWRKASESFAMAGDSDEVGFWRGLSLAALYREQVRQATDEPEEGRREQILSEAEQDYRQPALTLLRQASSDGDSDTDDLTRGLLALTDRRYEASRERLRMVLERSPWRFEAQALIGESYEAEATQHVLAGEWDGAFELWQRAAAAYEEALEVAPSAGQVHRRLCAMQTRGLRTASFHRPARMADLEPRALSACQNAAANDSRSAAILTDLAQSHVYAARTAMRSGGDAGPNLDAALRVTGQALAIDQNLVAAWTAKANVHRLLSWEAMDSDRSPIAAVDAGRKAISRALAIDPDDVGALTIAANLELDLAEWQLAEDESPVEALNRGIEMLERATTLRPRDDVPLSNLAIAHSIKVDYLLDDGEDASAAMDMALAAYRRAELNNPRDSFVFGSRGVLLNHYAEHQAEAGEPFRDTLAQAVSDVRRAAELSPNDLYRQYNLAATLRKAAELRQRAGSSWRDTLDEAMHAVDTALSLKPDDPDSLILKARGLRLAADAGDGPLEEALNALARARALVDDVGPRDYKDRRITLLELDATALRLRPPDQDCRQALESLRARAEDILEKDWSHRAEWLVTEVFEMRCGY